ncbi:MAG: hypothetical protein AABW51_01660 [Nanoarchaeota archaeon]
MEKSKLVKCLKLAENELPNACGTYQGLFGNDLQFFDPSQFTFIQKKAYTARAEIKVNIRKGPAKIMSVIAFVSGDGTGDTSLYSAQELIVPEEYQFRIKPERVFPRSKKEVVMEAFFPLFSIRGNDVCENAICLEELSTTKEGNRFGINLLGWLGQIPDVYGRTLLLKTKADPQVGLTKGYRRNGDKFGDPHAIHYPTKSVNPDTLQVVGFLGLNKDDQYIMEILDGIAVIPK